jgi:rhamnose transport system ATP-binding protein
VNRARAEGSCFAKLGYPATLPVLLSASCISKSFEGVRALRDVSFDLNAGEVHALVGENGAGKSTLIKVMTGAEHADAGTLVLSGRTVPHMTPAIARSLGIAAIYQQPSLFAHLSVAENLALSLETGSVWRRVHWAARRRRALDLLEEVGAAIDPERLAATLSMPEQQMVEIAKAVGAHANIVIMDEPTASLMDSEIERLFRVIGLLRAQGGGIVYISHRLEEVFAVSDRITVLRDGEAVATQATTAIDRAGLIQTIVGRALTDVFPKRAVALGECALELRQLSNRALGLHHVSLSVRCGEVLGVAGLVGSGRTELAETLFGLVPADGGEILVRGAAVQIESPSQAIQHGIGYVPEDRRQHGVVLEMPVASNASLASLAAVSSRGIIDRVAERRSAERYVERLRIKTPSVSTEVGALSGGNQQKVALARWLSIGPQILILDEPTQGVDVGAKAEIHALIQDLAERGLAIVMISSELPEILGMSDRVLVMRAGTVSGVLSRAEATQDKILALALSATPADAAPERPSGRSSKADDVD